MNKRKEDFFKALIVSLIHALICFLSGAINWYTQMIIVCIAGCVSIFFIIKVIGTSWYSSLFVVLPFYAIYIPASVFLKSYETFPIWGCGIFICVISYFLLKKNINIIFSGILLIGLISFGRYVVMPNNFALLNEKNNLTKYDFNELFLKTINDSAFKRKDFVGKVILFDIWHSSCLPCIKRFPELQKLHQRFNGDTLVKIYSLNIPLEKDKGIKSTKFTDPFTFEKLYFQKKTDADNMGIEAVPLILIFDKDFKCRYAGDLNTGDNVIYNNADKILQHLKKL